MKRSTQIGLAAAGVVLVATAWSLSGGEAEGDLVYNSLDECKQAGRLGNEACEKAFADATAARLTESPRFPTQSACEQQYGSFGCSAATINGVQYFLPALAGFMLARNIAGGGMRPAAPLLPPTQSACPPGSRQPGSGRPECEQTRSSSSSSGGSSGGSRSRSYSSTSGMNFTATSTAAGSVATQTAASRGGFGSTARSFSSSSSS